MRYSAVKQVMESSLFSCHEIDYEELYNHFNNCNVVEAEFDKIEGHIKRCGDCRKRYAKEFELFARNQEAYFRLIKHLYDINEVK